MINSRISLFGQTRSLADATGGSRLPCGRLRLALSPRRRLLPRRCLAGKKQVCFFVSPINPKSVTYVSERLLPFSPVQTAQRGERGIKGTQAGGLCHRKKEGPSRAGAKICIPKLELGNEKMGIINYPLIIPILFQGGWRFPEAASHAMLTFSQQT